MQEVRDIGSPPDARALVRGAKRWARHAAPQSVYHLYRRLRFELSGGAPVRVMNRFADADRIAIDVGANIGVFSAALARRFASVAAYEPDRVMAAQLRRHAPGNVTVYPIALSDREGTATLLAPVWFGEPSRAHGSLSKRFEGDEVIETLVRTCRLDGMGHRNVGFVKIDVEGHEASVLRGAEALLREDRPPIWIEIERDHHASGDIGEVFELLESMGYAGRFDFDGREHPLSEFEPDVHQPLVNGMRPPGERVSDFLFLSE